MRLLGLLAVLLAQVVHDIGKLSVILGLLALTASGAGSTLELLSTGLTLWLLADGRQGPRWQLAGELIEKVLAAGLLEVLLAHGCATFKAGVNKGGRARHDTRWVYCRLVHLLINLALVFRVERGHLGRLAVK